MKTKNVPVNENSYVAILALTSNSAYERERALHSQMGLELYAKKLSFDAVLETVPSFCLTEFILLYIIARHVR